MEEPRIQNRTEETAQQKTPADRLARVVNIVIAVPVVCFIILRVLAFILA